jgi:serine protease Do
MKRKTLIFAIILYALGTVPDAQALTDQQAIDQLKMLNQAYTAIAARVTKSVVTVTTKRVEDVRSQGRPMPDFFHRFRFPEPQERESSGVGSGIIMSTSGYILTNNHVIENADEITVILSDKREYRAELVGSDDLTDVAVIRIDGENLHPLATGDSDGIRIGEWVLAVGAPLDLRSTVTSGIVSAIGRSLDIIQNDLSVENFIQVDAAINPGNSGGALVNLDGELIGINTAIATRNRGFVGYGFAIPINLAKKVMDDIIEHGEVRRAYLGVGLKPVSAAEADAFGLDRPKGVLIDLVMEDTPAERAHFKRGDIVLKVNGEEVDRPNHLQSIIARKHPGDVAEFSIRRNDQDLTIKATLGSIPKDDEEVAESEHGAGSETEHLGLTVSDLTPQVMEAFGLSGDTKGVVVTRVSRGPGKTAGFVRGDVIFAVRQRRLDVTVESVADFESVMTELQPGRSAAFSVIRKIRSGGERYLFLTPLIPS